MTAIQVFEVDPRMDRRKRARAIAKQASAYENPFQGRALIRCCVDNCELLFETHKGHTAHWNSVHSGNGVELYGMYPVGSRGKRRISKRRTIVKPSNSYSIASADTPITCTQCTAKKAKEFKTSDSLRRHMQKGRHQVSGEGRGRQTNEEKLQCLICQDWEDEHGNDSGVVKYATFRCKRSLDRHMDDGVHTQRTGKRPDLRVGGFC